MCCRNKQTRLFMIQRQIMASLGLTRRPAVPHRRDRNATDAAMERLLPLLQQGIDDDGDGGSLNGSTTASLYVVKRVHALLPTCRIQRQRQLCSTGECCHRLTFPSRHSQGRIKTKLGLMPQQWRRVD